MGSKECVKVSLEWKFRYRYYTNIRHHWPKPLDDDRRWWKMQHACRKQIADKYRRRCFVSATFLGKCEQVVNALSCHVWSVDVQGRTRNSVIADKPRDALVQYAIWHGWPKTCPSPMYYVAERGRSALKGVSVDRVEPQIRVCWGSVPLEWGWGSEPLAWLVVLRQRV